MKLAGQLAMIIFGFALLSIGALVGFVVITPVRGISLVWLGVFVAWIVVSLTFLWFFLRRKVLRPVKTLSNAVTRVRLGDLTQVVPVKTHDEIGELSQNFNDMTHQLVITQGTLMDARKAAEERLAELQSSINSLRQGFVITDAAGKILQANDTIQRLVMPADQQSSDPAAPLTMQQLSTLFATETHLTESVMRSMQTKEPMQFTALPYQEGRYVNLFIAPVIAEEAVIGSVLLLEDVTEERILQRSRDEFFSIASHELRTPLTAIRGNMSMARDYFPALMQDEALKDLVNDTQAASVRLIEIVNDFLDSSRLEQGKMSFNFREVNIGPLISGVNDDLKPLWEQQKNTITTDHLEQLPAVWADEGRLRQILYNLMSNANKYCEQATITVSGADEGDMVRIRVSDTGKGISPEYQKLLFHKFQQASSDMLTRDNTKGTGLGLYISRLLATNMKGTVELEHSEIGKGTTFAVVMPKATPALQQAAAASKPSTPAAQAPTIPATT